METGDRASWVAAGHYNIRGGLLVHDVLLFDRALEVYNELKEKKRSANATVTLRHVRGNNLAPKDESGASDPFFKILLPKDDKMHELWKSPVMKANLNPSWASLSESLTIPVFDNVALHLYDWDRFSTNDFMGRVEFKPALVYAFQQASGKSEFTLNFNSLMQTPRLSEHTEGHEHVVSGHLSLTLSVHIA